MDLVPYNPRPVTLQVSKKSKSKAVKSGITPSPNAVVYRGPLQLPKTKSADDVWSTQLNVINAVASGGTGVINTVFDSINQVQSSSDWASLAALWNEFRVLSMRVQLVPWNKYNLATPATTPASPLYTVTDRNDNTALGSLSTVANYNSAEQHEPSTKVVRSLKMDGVDEAEWTSTSTGPGGSARMYVKLFSSGNANSTTYYDYFNSYIVQFRGRK